MGRVRVDWDETGREYELARASLVGRHPICHVAMLHPDVPAFWLEIRFTASRWAWRAFQEDERRTEPAGEVVRDDWRSLELGPAGAIGCVGGARLQLVDAAPPRAFAVDLGTGTERVGASFEALVRTLTEGEQAALQDHRVSVVRGRPMRFHEVG